MGGAPVIAVGLKCVLISVVHFPRRVCNERLLHDLGVRAAVCHPDNQIARCEVTLREVTADLFPLTKRVRRPVVRQREIDWLETPRVNREAATIVECVDGSDHALHLQVGLGIATGTGRRCLVSHLQARDVLERKDAAEVHVARELRAITRKDRTAVPARLIAVVRAWHEDRRMRVRRAIERVDVAPAFGTPRGHVTAQPWHGAIAQRWSL